LAKLVLEKAQSFKSLATEQKPKPALASILIIPWVKNNEKLESIHFMNLRFISVIAADSPLLQEYEAVPKAVMKNYSQVIISGRTSSTTTYGVLEGGDQWRVNDFQTKKEIIMQAWAGAAYPST